MISYLKQSLPLLILISAVPCVADYSLSAESFAPDPQYCLVAGDGGNVFISSNGGYLWALDVTLNIDVRGAVAFDDGGAVVVGGSCKGVSIDFLTKTVTCDIFKRNPLSGNWTRSNFVAYAPTFNNIDRLNAVAFCNVSLGFVVGSNGGILRTVDSGGTWTLITTGVSGNFNVVACSVITKAAGPPQVVVVAAGDQGLLAQSLDAGTSWSRSSTILYSSGYSTGNITSLLWGSGTLKGLALLRGSPGGIYYTIDAGYTWSPVSLPVSFLSWSPAAAAAPFAPAAAPLPYRSILLGSDAAASPPRWLPLQSSVPVAQALSPSAPAFVWANMSAPAPIDAVLSIAAAGLGR